MAALMVEHLKVLLVEHLKVMAALTVEPAYASLLVERATHPAGPLLISRACLSILIVSFILRE